jgi:pSer/pThr/pTyr-binding forkhead associated (FHA) protein
MDRALASDTDVAYLLVDGVTVYELLPNASLTIGRLDTNNVVLDDYKVSREHAVLKSVGERYVVIDLASTHGTKVNDEKVAQSEVQFGDRITIVSHELVLFAEKPSIESSEHVSSLREGGASVRKLDRRVKFFGGLNEFALITLVQFLYQEKQHGLLMLEEGQQPGPRIYFQGGEIIHVVDGERLGDLLTRQIHEQSLFFYFHHETEFPERTIQSSTPNYLMELCHSQDIKRQEADASKSLATLKLPQVKRPSSE